MRQIDARWPGNPVSESGILQIPVGNKAYQRIPRLVGRKGVYRRLGPPEILLVSIASAAESFRSTCGPERGAPECSKQRSPVATPHVGHGTENNCFAVRSLFLIWVRYDKTSRKTVPFRTLCAPAIGNCRSYRRAVVMGFPTDQWTLINVLTRQSSVR